MQSELAGCCAPSSTTAVAAKIRSTGNNWRNKVGDGRDRKDENTHTHSLAKMRETLLAEEEEDGAAVAKVFSWQQQQQRQSSLCVS